MSDEGGEDDTEDVMSEVMSIPDSETLKDISEALYDDVKAEYVNELDDKAHDTLHAAIHYISVFYQVVRQREKHGEGGVRGRQEIGEVYETAEDLDEALGREISTLEAEKEAAQVPTPALTRTISILKGVRRRVLGEDGDL